MVSGRIYSIDICYWKSDVETDKSWRCVDGVIDALTVGIHNYCGFMCEQ